MKSQQVAEPWNLNLKTICWECMFLVTAPRPHNAYPAPLGLVHSLFHYLSSPNIMPLREPPAQPLHVQYSTWSTYLKCCCHASEVSVAFAPLEGYAGMEGRGKGTSRVLHNPPYLFLQLASVPANTDWEPILASEQEQKTTQQNQRCLVCWRTWNANLWARRLDHFVGPAQLFQPLTM